jgi:hypothetical protein
MKKKIGSNMYQESINGVEVLYSYETPVACKACGLEYRTEVKYSQTTTKHINKWLNGKGEEKPQSYFDQLVRG